MRNQNPQGFNPDNQPEVQPYGQNNGAPQGNFQQPQQYAPQNQQQYPGQFQGQPQQQFQQGYQQPAPQKNAGPGLKAQPWNKIVGGVLGVLGILLIVFHNMRWYFAESSVSGSVFGHDYGTSAATEWNGFGTLSADFLGTGSAVASPGLFMWALLAIAGVLVGAVLLFLGKYNRFGLFSVIGGSALGLIFTFYMFTAIDPQDATKLESFDVGLFGQEASFDEGRGAGVFLALITYVVILGVSIWLLVARKALVNTQAPLQALMPQKQPAQFGQPQQGVYMQPQGMGVPQQGMNAPQQGMPATPDAGQQNGGFAQQPDNQQS